MVDTINILSTFTGGGWLDTGVRLALDVRGLRGRSVGYIERDAAAAATILARVANATLAGECWRGVLGKTGECRIRPLVVAYAFGALWDSVVGGA